jgi:hypothetical protein
VCPGIGAQIVYEAGGFMTSDAAFLYGKDLDDAIREILERDNARMAVAFWGAGISELMPESGDNSQQLICNLMSGATNPHEIDKIRKYVNVHQVDDLHAKVYLCDTHAIVTSANASANGLGFEGKEQSRWQEAGVLVKDTISIEQWFKDLWASSRPVKDDDIEKALEVWKPRQQCKPTVPFARYVIPEDDVPLPLWYQSSNWTPRKEAVADQVGELTPEIEWAMDYGVEVYTNEDRTFFDQPRWVLHFRLGKSGKVTPKFKLEWAYTDMLLKGVCEHEGYKGAYDCVIATNNPPPPPFDEKEPRLKEAFRSVINRKEYKFLLDDIKESESWYAPRLGDIRAFWLDVKTEYNKL